MSKMRVSPCQVIAGASLALVMGLAIWLAYPFGSLADGDGGPALGPEIAAPQIAPGTRLYPSPHERFGVGVHLAYGDILSYNVSVLHAGWYVDWQSRQSPPHPVGMDYAQMVRVGGTSFSPDWPTLAQIAAADPGALWLIGNEPDAPYGQDNVTPEVYAARYHDLYVFLKQQDPTAQIAAGGLVQATPLRLQYLDRILAAYQSSYGTALPADAWHTHEQILQEVRGEWGCSIPAGFEGINTGTIYSMQDNANPAIFQQHIVALRQWLKNNGYQNKPLYVSEYGVLMPSCYLKDEPGCDSNLNASVAGTLSVTYFMTSTFTYMLSATDPSLGYPADDYRLVQRWSWYSLNERPFNYDYFAGFNGGLFSYSNPHQITTFGIAYGNFVAGQVVSYVDLLPGRVQIDPAPVALVSPGGTATFTVTATIWNRGNTTASNVRVRFLDRAGGTPLASDQIIAGPLTRYVGTTTAQVVRANLSPGAYQVYVQVDPDNAIVEAYEDNNTAVVDLLVATQRVFLPIISRNR